MAGCLTLLFTAAFGVSIDVQTHVDVASRFCTRHLVWVLCVTSARSLCLCGFKAPADFRLSVGAVSNSRLISSCSQALSGGCCVNYAAVGLRVVVATVSGVHSNVAGRRVYSIARALLNDKPTTAPSADRTNQHTILVTHATPSHERNNQFQL